MNLLFSDSFEQKVLSVQESLVLDRFGSLSPSSPPPPAADKLRVGEYIVNTTTTRKLGFFIKKVNKISYK